MNNLNVMNKTTMLETSSEISNFLKDLDRPFYVVRRDGQPVLLPAESFDLSAGEETLAYIPALPIESLGDPAFKQAYGLRYAYYTGAMASGIASTDLVIALGKAGLLGSFGAAGLGASRIEAAIQAVQAALPDGPYAFNLINSPSEEALERNAVALYLKYGVHVIEASAYLDLTAPLVHYRVAGLSKGPNGEVQIANRVIAKLSRREVAEKFMQPAPEALLNRLLQEGSITPEQAELAKQVPMADDVTAEADSAGHTDNRPLVCLLPGIMALRDAVQAKYHYATPIRVGAAGGISTPASTLAAFMMGAAYIATGSVNQACVESGASDHTKEILAKAGMTDVTMAPSADMFEMGVKVQVLKMGTLYPMRAQKLYELYNRYESVEQIPADERAKLEKQVFQRDMDSIWQDTVKFFTERDPAQIERAADNPKRKMALIFRWYLGLSSRWSAAGEKGREMDYQVWCGPAMGSFNDWTRGTYLAEPQNRHAVDVALHLLTGAAYQYRQQLLKLQGVALPADLGAYVPTSSLAN